MKCYHLLPIKENARNFLLIFLLIHQEYLFLSFHLELSHCYVICMVSTIISKHDSHKACGFDHISAIVLNKCDLELAPILSKVYNWCPAASCFPDCWISFFVVPVFKTFGKPSDPSNYHLISLLHLFGKSLEALMNSELVKRLTGASFR